MFVMVFVVSIALTVWLIQKQNQAEDNESMLQFTKQQSLVILGMFLVSVVLEVVSQLLPDLLDQVYWYVVGAFLVICMSVLFVLNKTREKQIQEEHQQIQQIFDALSKLLGKVKEIDYNHLPFTYGMKNGRIHEIKIEIGDADRFTDNNATQAAFSLNKFFPYYQWTFSIDIPKKECVFQGEQLPPQLAKWVGSDLRPAGWIPLGVAGAGEAGWNMANPKDLGHSNYIDETGERIGTVVSSSAPQGLGVGSTGGGKSIWVDSTVQILARQE